MKQYDPISKPTSALKADDQVNSATARLASTVTTLLPPPKA
jgi:hypothetical protein